MLQNTLFQPVHSGPETAGCFKPNKIQWKIQGHCPFNQSCAIISNFPTYIKLRPFGGEKKSMHFIQCCGFGMIYSGSGLEFSEFQIQAKVPDPCELRNRIQPILLKYISNNNSNTFYSIKKKNINNYLTFSINITVPQYKQSSIQFYLSALSLFAGSRTIIPDPQHCFHLTRLCLQCKRKQPTIR